MAKGEVKVESFKGRLRLRWSYKGKRYGFSLGLADSKSARTVVQRKVSEIEGDLITGNFDPTLKKDKGEEEEQPSASGLGASELFKRYTVSTLARIS